MTYKNHSTEFIELSIESLAPGGDGIAFHDNRTFYVPGTAPGDVVSASFSKGKGKTIQTRLQRILSPGDARRPPPCPLASQCGGCSWQHVHYNVQVAAKKNILQRALRRDNIEMLASPVELQYRRVARMHAKRTRSGQAVLGFFESHDSRIVDIADCPVLEDAIRQALIPLKDGPLSTLTQSAEVTLAAGEKGVLASIRTRDPLKSETYTQLSSLIPHVLCGAHVHADGLGSHLGGFSHVEVKGSDDLPLFFPPGSFGQANNGINALLIRQIVSWITERGPFSKCLELFAGAGNLSVPLRHLVPRLITAELDDAACRCSRRAFEDRQLDGVTVEKADVVQAYGHHAKKCDLVVLDPPRTGHEELARAMKTGNHRAIIYVSCNPFTFARDIAHLREGGYRISDVVGFDMFPQTPHVEAAVLLEK